MAKDVITRFKLETTSYDSKLRDAAKGLADYTKTATTAGKEFGKFTQSNVEAARALGNIIPSATNAKDKVKELVGAFNEAASAYNHLTKEQQQQDFAKAMAESLSKLKVQIAEAKQELYGMGDAMKKTGGGLFGGLGDKMSGMLQVFGGNMMTKGVSMLTSELAGSVQQSIELARQGEGIRIAFERLNQPGLLDELKTATHGTVSEIELMKQAIKFENFKLPVEDLANYLAFAQQKAKDTGESIDYLVNSIVTGLGRQSKQILDNLGISAAELTRRMNEGATMTQAVSDIIREEMAKSGDYIETAADRAARATADTKNKMEELGRSAMPVAEEFASAWTEIRNGAMTLVLPVLSTVADSIRDIREILGGEWDMPKLKPGIQNLADGPAKGNQSKKPTWGDVPVVKAPGGYVEVTDKSGKVLHSGHYDSDAQLQNMMKRWNTLTSATGGTRRTSSPSRQQTEMQKNQAEIAKLTQEYVRLGDSETEASRQRQAEIQKEIQLLEKRNGQLKLYQEQAQGKLLGPDAFKQQLSVDVAVNNKKIEELEQQLLSLNGITIDPKTVKVTAETDEARQKVEELKRQIAELKDQNLMINAGMASLDLQNARDLSRTGGVTGFVGTGKNAMPVEGLPSMGDVVRQRGGNLLDDKAMKAVNEDISRNLPKEKDSPLESGKKLLSGISQLTDGLEKIGIDIPDEIQSVITVIQGVMQVIEAVNTIIGGAQATALTANTVAMGVLTEALWANTASSWIPFANGGIVPKFAGGGLVGRAALGMTIPGNSFSGDNLRMPVVGGGMIGVNSGEVILNRAQAGVIASDLQGSGIQNLHLDAEIGAEKIRLVLNNRGRRTGKGEYVQSTRRR